MGQVEAMLGPSSARGKQSGPGAKQTGPMGKTKLAPAPEQATGEGEIKVVPENRRTGTRASNASPRGTTQTSPHPTRQEHKPGSGQDETGP